jgi:hypothetical protein
MEERIQVIKLEEQKAAEVKIDIKAEMTKLR